MAFDAHLILDPASQIGGAVGLTRDWGGVWYCVVFDSESGYLKSRLFNSFDDGRTWIADANSQAIGDLTGGLGGQNPRPMIDVDGRLWLATSRLDNVYKAWLLFYNAQTQTWSNAMPASSAIGDKIVNADFHALMEPTKEADGFQQIHVIYRNDDSGNVAYHSTTHGIKDAVISASADNQVEIRPAMAANGVLYCTWREQKGGGDVIMFSQFDDNLNTWSTAVEVNRSGDTVLHNLDMKVAPDGELVGLYARDVSGTAKMTLIRVRTNPASIVYEDIPDDALGYHFSVARLAFDALGGEHIIALAAKGANPEYVVMTRDYLDTTWRVQGLNANVGGGPIDPTEAYAPNMVRRGLRPMVPRRGWAGVFNIWNAGRTQDQGLAYFIHTDSPDFEPAAIAGEPVYGTKEEVDRLSVALPGEPTSSDVFPEGEFPVSSFRVARRFQTNKFEADDEHEIMRPKVSGDRGDYVIAFRRLSKARLDELMAFFESHDIGVDAFDWTLPHTKDDVSPTVITVQANADALDPVKIAPDVYRLTVPLIRSRAHAW